MRLKTLSLMLITILGVIGCSDDDPNSNNVVDIPDTGMNNVNNVDDMDAGTGDADMEADADAGGDTGTGPSCEGVMCDDDAKCVRGDCVPLDAKLACDELNEEGVLNIAQSHTLSGNTTNFVDTFDTACVETVNGYSGPENVFKFQVSSGALVRLTLTSSATNIDWLMAVRTGGCEDGVGVLCTDGEATQFVAQPGIDYYLVVEPVIGFDTGPFQVAMQFQEQACTPGDRTCMGDALEVCGFGTFDCAGGCDTGACGGDTCANAIEVTAAMSFSGDTNGYLDTFNFKDETSCSPAMQSGIATPGPDMVLRLPGLTVGQVISVDASMNDSNDNAIFVLDDCVEPAKACLAGRDIGDTLDYTVETAGDHIVVIDKLSASAKAFNYMIDIQ